MLTKRQLEDAAECKFAQGCNKKCGFYYEQELGDGDITDGCSLLIDELAQTALAYRKMLERLEWVVVGEREGEDEMIQAILCPSCDNWREEGHKDDCESAALLKGLEGESC
jgi:hypothetical protein